MDHILNNSEKPVPTEDDLNADADADEDEGESAVKAIEGQEAKVRPRCLAAGRYPKLTVLCSD
jgi:hypothetical protein